MAARGVRRRRRPTAARRSSVGDRGAGALGESICSSRYASAVCTPRRGEKPPQLAATAPEVGGAPAAIGAQLAAPRPDGCLRRRWSGGRDGTRPSAPSLGERGDAVPH